MSAATLDRTARHLALPNVGNAGVAKIAAGSVLVIGVGGIGCTVATYLASGGIGDLVLVDFDTVDASNLGRQPLYTPQDIGKLKVVSAAERLREINPDIQITTIDTRLQGESLKDAVAAADVVVDCCDNFATRFAVNEVCVAANRCLISTAAIRFEGQLSVFGPNYDDSACYRCVYSETDESLDDCAGNGVLAPVPAVIGAMGAVECLKEIVGLRASDSTLSLYDGLTTEWQKIVISKQKNCPTCGIPNI